MMKLISRARAALVANRPLRHSLYALAALAVPTVFLDLDGVVHRSKLLVGLVAAVGGIPAIARTVEGWLAARAAATADPPANAGGNIAVTVASPSSADLVAQIVEAMAAYTAGRAPRPPLDPPAAGSVPAPAPAPLPAAPAATMKGTPS